MPFICFIFVFGKFKGFVHCKQRLSKTSLHVIASSVLDKEYLNDHNGRTGLVLASKTILINLSILPHDKSAMVEIFKIIQIEVQFVVLARKAYHKQFNCEYIVAQETDLTGILCLEVNRLVSKNREFERALMQCTILVPMILWNETTSLVSFQSQNLSCPYNVWMVISLIVALKNTSPTAESIMDHFVRNDNGNILI